MKAKEQRYQRIGQLRTNEEDDEVIINNNHTIISPNTQLYRDEPSDSAGNYDNINLPVSGPLPLQRVRSTPITITIPSTSSSSVVVSNALDHPLDQSQQQQQQQQPSSMRHNNSHDMRSVVVVDSNAKNNINNMIRKQLRMRRSPSNTMSPPTSRSGSIMLTAREGSSDNLVLLEDGTGDLSSSLEQVNGMAKHKHKNNNNNNSASNSFSSLPRGIKRDKNSNDEGSSSSSSSSRCLEDTNTNGDCNSDRGGAVMGEGSGSHGEDGDALFCASHGSSFDLLDDEDEINLQRYNRDFGASPYTASYREGDFIGGGSGWDDEGVGGLDRSFNMYHPRSDTAGSKDPWIRMVQQHNQQSPTNNNNNNINGGNMTLSSIHSMSDLLLYLQGVRRQARQRRAQRLLTMPSEQWWQRFQFFFMTYCWDATDVGLLVVAILLIVWFTGLLWLARVNASNNVKGAHKDSEQQTNGGAEYNANAEFDGYEEAGENSSSLYVLFQWLWWALGFVLLVRILGPVAVYKVNNRRRERRRQRFMSGNMRQQQERMQQQQLPNMMVASSAAYSDDEDPLDTSMQEVSVAGLEITETNRSHYASESSSSLEGTTTPQ